MDDLGGKQNGNPRTTVPLIRETTQVYRSTTNSVYIITQVSDNQCVHVVLNIKRRRTRGYYIGDLR